MSPQELVCFDNEAIVLQPSNVAALFFSRAKDEAAAPTEVAVAVPPKPPPNLQQQKSQQRKSTTPQEFVAFAKAKHTKSSPGDVATKTNLRNHGSTVQKKAVAVHLLLENSYESNLVSDIAKVDYLAGTLGRTNLRPLAGLQPFVDDIYVFDYLSREE